MDYKNEKLSTDIMQGLDYVRDKLKKVGDESSEFKSALNKIEPIVYQFEEYKAKEMARIESDNERLRIIEKHLAKSNLDKNIDQFKVKDEIDQVFKKMLTSGEVVSNKEYPLIDLCLKTQTVTDGASGGNLVREEFLDNMMITYMKDASPMFREANVVTTSLASAKTITKSVVNFGSRSSGELQDSRGKTSRDVSKVIIPLHRYFSVDSTSQDLVESVSVDPTRTIVSNIMADISYRIQYDCLRGDLDGRDGLATPKGLLKEEFLMNTAFRSPGQARDSSLLRWEDIYEVQDAFDDSYASRYTEKGKFFLTRKAFNGILTTQTTTGEPIYLPNLIAFRPSTLNGFPFAYMPAMDKVLSANTMPLLFGDMKAAYTIFLTNNYKVYRDENNQMESGVIRIGMSTFAGGSVIDEHAIRAVRGL